MHHHGEVSFSAPTHPCTKKHLEKTTVSFVLERVKIQARESTVLCPMTFKCSKNPSGIKARATILKMNLFNQRTIIKIPMDSVVSDLPYHFEWFRFTRAKHSKILGLVALTIFQGSQNPIQPLGLKF